MEPFKLSNGNPTRILAIHQGAELYGSDRSFAQCVQGIRKAFPDAQLDVKLGHKGPLEEFLRPHSDKIIIDDLWIARKSRLFRLVLLGGPHLLWNVIRHARDIWNYDLIYINTIVVLDYVILSLVMPKSSVIHVREIPDDSAFGKLMKFIVRSSKSLLICNSRATLEAYQPVKAGHGLVIHNGVNVERATMKKREKQDSFNIVVLGRISSWKGQDLLLHAIAQMPEKLKQRVKLKIIGSAFEGNEHLERELHDFVAANALETIVEFVPFTQNVSAFYGWADLVVNPSRKAEPFGRVIVEAMANALPVVAAAHGGPLEIVENDKTGLLFTPNDASSLADSLARLAQDADLCTEFGENGYKKYIEDFTEEKMQTKLVDAIKTWIKH